MVILFGAVGSGKTEQGERLAKHLKCLRISTSYLLRQEANPERLKQIAEGTLVSDQAVLNLLGPELQKVGADKNEFILDGSPRSIAQAEWLVAKIKTGDIKFTAVIYLKAPIDTVIERLMKRGRPDDKEDIIRHRLDEYAKVTTPVLDYLKQAGYQVDEVDGSPAPDKVEAEIQAVLEAKNASR